MRALLAIGALLTVVAGGVASAKPVLHAPDLELLDEYVEPCSSGKSWRIVERCLEPKGTLELVYETDTARVIKVSPRPNPSQASTLLLYAKNSTGWTRSNLYAVTNATTELLGITKFVAPGGEGIQIEIGSVAPQRISIDQTKATRRAIVRRVSTAVCMPDGWSCRTFVTNCEVYVEGKVYWTFQGELFWHSSLGLRIRGNAANAGLLCKPGKPVFVEAE